MLQMKRILILSPYLMVLQALGRCLVVAQSLQKKPRVTDMMCITDQKIAMEEFCVPSVEVINSSYKSAWPI